MKEFRDAASQALQVQGVLPYGMERFTAHSVPVIERCYEEIEDSQFFISIVGFRYGSLYPNMELSYSELEYNKAVELGLPVLVFIQHEDQRPDLNKLTTEQFDDYNRVKKYRERLEKSGTARMVTYFKTADELKAKLSQAVNEEIKRREEKARKLDEAAENYKKGAKIYKKFLLMPGRYCSDKNKQGEKVRLRVRFDGYFGSWHLKEELFEAFEIDHGDAVYFNDLFVEGIEYDDLGDEAKHIDCFATGDAAEWILENEITKGCVFEGTFSLEWKLVRNIAGKSRLQLGASDAYIAKLVLRDSDLKLISTKSKPQSVDRVSSVSQDSILEMLSKLM